MQYKTRKIKVEVLLIISFVLGISFILFYGLNPTNVGHGIVIFLFVPIFIGVLTPMRKHLN